MKKEEVLDIINQSRVRGVSEKEICIEFAISPKNLYYYKKKYGLLENTRGRSINSRKQRDYYIDDDFFSVPNVNNSYWAGFIAADGNISKDYKQLSFGLALKDKAILENMIKDMDSNYVIRNYKSHEYNCVALTIASSKICSDLLLNFNITDNKSLTLVHPNLSNSLIDAFIVGYIDGDGTIGLYNSKKQKSLRISLLGTLSMCNWIKERFSFIYSKEIGTIFNDKRHTKNTFSYSITDRSARLIYEYLYKIPVNKLKRKWSNEKLEHCTNYKKARKNSNRYEEILNLKSQGLNHSDIAKIIKCSQANISWYIKQEYFIELEKNLETKLLDKGEVDIETDN